MTTLNFGVIIKRAVICQKQISDEGNGHCCHRPSSNWETNLYRYKKPYAFHFLGNEIDVKGLCACMLEIKTLIGKRIATIVIGSCYSSEIPLGCNSYRILVSLTPIYRKHKLQFDEPSPSIYFVIEIVCLSPQSQSVKCGEP